MNTKTETYIRVIPRDFFNEAKLLKCMGLLSLMVLDRMIPEGINIEIDESGDPFNIELNEDGLLFVSNYQVLINNTPVFVGTTYNSKENYPFVAYVNYVEYPIFDEHGNFTDEFIKTFSI